MSMFAQDNPLEGLPDSKTVEIPWAPGQRNFRMKLLHRYDGAIQLRIDGAENTPKGRDMVARVLASIAEEVRLGRVTFS